MRRLVVVVAVVIVLVVCAGCSVLGTMAALGEAGFSVSSVAVNTTSGSTTVAVVAASPPGVPREVAVERAERVLWQTQRSRIDRIDLLLDGTETTATREQLTARFGPRDPALDTSNVDQVLLVGVFTAVGLAVAIAVTVAVVLTRRRRRRLRAGGVPPDPWWAATDVVGVRAGQFVIDYLVWWVPTVAGMVLVVVGSATWVAQQQDSVPVGFFAAGAAWWVLAVGWGWFTGAYWPAGHHGQTFGMRRTGLRVVSVDGSPVGLGRHSVRWLLLLVDTGFVGLVALLAMSTSPRHQRLGDMATGTVVVRVAPAPASSPVGGAPPTIFPNQVR